MRSVAVLTTAVLVLAGCGGSKQADRKAAPTPAPLPTDPIAITKAWADAVRTNDIPRATKLFAIPAIVSNDTPLLELDTTAQVADFNGSFPCGATFVRASTKSGGRVLTTYTLTERPGAPAPCGTGTGARAGVLFTIKGGKIVRWIRADPEPGPARTPKPQL